MDFAGFLLASGFALLVVLLGWADQITSKSKDVKDLEEDFLKKAEFKRGDYKTIIKEGGATEGSFSALVGFLYSKKEKDVEIFEKIKEIKIGISSLDTKYGRRFWILVWMSASLFVTGIIALLIPNDYKIWVLSPNLIFVVLVFNNLITVHSLEKQYKKNISETMEKL